MSVQDTCLSQLFLKSLRNCVWKLGWANYDFLKYFTEHYSTPLWINFYVQWKVADSLWDSGYHLGF